MFTPLFTAEQYNTQLQQQGYAIVPFLQPEEIAELTAFFYGHHPALPDGMYASSHAPDFALRQKMDEKIKAVCQRAVSSTFQQARMLGATFMVKSKGENGSLHPHQAWTIVDETKHYSDNLWLPLVDVNENNGTILLLPDSHRWMNNIRGLNIPSSLEPVANDLWPLLKPICLKAGEALLYDHRMIHASGINQTPQPRLVVVYGLIPEKAEMRFYHGEDNHIAAYSCSPSFYFQENILHGPADLPLLQRFPNNNPKLSTQQLKTLTAPSSGLRGLLKKIWPF